MKIALTRGMFATVDPEDFERFGSIKWYARPKVQKLEGYYAQRTVAAERGIITTEYLHRVIIGAQVDQIVDHINGDGLDCRKSNLRVATCSQNNANRLLPPPKSGFRGVYQTKSGWRARIWANGSSTSLGYYPNAHEAAKAYDNAAVAAFGAFARTNFSEVV